MLRAVAAEDVQRASLLRKACAERGSGEPPPKLARAVSSYPMKDDAARQRSEVESRAISEGVGDSSPRRKVAFAAIVYFGEPISQSRRLLFKENRV